MLSTVRERPIERAPSRTHGPPSKPISERPYESLPATTRFVQRRLMNPLRNHLLPARLVRGLLSFSRSPLVIESLIRPGGWRSMEITYRNDEPVDFIDRMALRQTPMSLASRNRRNYVTATIARLIREFAADGPVSILGVGAGPGLQVQNAIVASEIDPQRVTAHLIDLDDDAFAYGRQNAQRLGIAGSLHFLRGDACRIEDVLPHVAPQIVKIVGLAEYLNDRQLLDLLRTMSRIMPPGAALVTHGLIDAWGNAPFLKRVFNLRHQARTGEAMAVMLRSAGFEVAGQFVEPIGIFPILTARQPAKTSASPDYSSSRY